MSQVCNRCYKIVSRACQSDTEALECINLKHNIVGSASLDTEELGRAYTQCAAAELQLRYLLNKQLEDKRNDKANS